MSIASGCPRLTILVCGVPWQRVRGWIMMECTCLNALFMNSIVPEPFSCSGDFAHLDQSRLGYT